MNSGALCPCPVSPSFLGPCSLTPPRQGVLGLSCTFPAPSISWLSYGLWCCGRNFVFNFIFHFGLRHSIHSSSRVAFVYIVASCLRPPSSSILEASTPLGVDTASLRIPKPSHLHRGPFNPAFLTISFWLSGVCCINVPRLLKVMSIPRPHRVLLEIFAPHQGWWVPFILILASRPLAVADLNLLESFWNSFHTKLAVALLMCQEWAGELGKKSALYYLVNPIFSL